MFDKVFIQGLIEIEGFWRAYKVFIEFYRRFTRVHSIDECFLTL